MQQDMVHQIAHDTPGREWGNAWRGVVAMHRYISMRAHECNLFFLTVGIDPSKSRTGRKKWEDAGEARDIIPRPPHTVSIQVHRGTGGTPDTYLPIGTDSDAQGQTKRTRARVQIFVLRAENIQRVPQMAKEMGGCRRTARHPLPTTKHGVEVC